MLRQILTKCIYFLSYSYFRLYVLILYLLHVFCKTFENKCLKTINLWGCQSARKKVVSKTENQTWLMKFKYCLIYNMLHPNHNPPPGRIFNFLRLSKKWHFILAEMRWPFHSGRNEMNSISIWPKWTFHFGQNEMVISFRPKWNAIFLIVLRNMLPGQLSHGWSDIANSNCL